MSPWSLPVTPELEVSAALVDTAGRPATPSYAGILRIAGSGDTVRVSFARPVKAWYELRVTVPEGVALRLAGDNGGPLRVSGIGGSVEVTHSNGRRHGAERVGPRDDRHLERQCDRRAGHA